MASEGVGLKQQVSLLNGVTIIVGSIVGSGIFVSPKGVLENTGSVGLSLIIWLVGGLFSLVGSYCYAELGTCIRRSGADYAYIMEAFGPFLAFIRLWVESVVVRPCTTAVVALTFAYYVIEPFYPDCDQPQEVIQLLAALCIIILTLVNCWSVKATTMVQDLFTLAKLIALALIIITGFVQIGLGRYEYFKRPFENTKLNAGAISLAFYQSLFAYNGWNFLNYVIEELKDPYKNLPRAIFISVPLVTVIYVLANVAYFTVMSPQDILDASAVAVTFSKRLYGPIWWIMPICVALSTFGGVNGVLFTSSRLFFVGAQEGHMPEILSMVQINRNTPAPSVMFMGFVSLLYLISTDMYSLINYIGFVNWGAIGLSVVALLVFRYKRPDIERPIKVPLIWPILYVAGSIFLVIFPLFASPRETGYGILIVLSGVPVYLIFVVWQSKPKSFHSMMRKLTHTIQKLMLVVPEDRTADVDHES